MPYRLCRFVADCCRLDSPPIPPHRERSRHFRRAVLALIDIEHETLGHIPAHAGETTPTQCLTTPLSAHPCARRGDLSSVAAVLLTWGTSLRTQGRQIAAAEAHFSRGHIPAHAGETCFPLRHRATRRAHPCARRETQPEGPVQRLGRAHPCARRGDLGVWLPIKRKSGTSLRTQGRLLADGYLAERLGHIPAHAGETSLNTSAACKTGAHPCARRGDAETLPLANARSGTSLRTH